jgi:hypothetical protein
MTPFIPVKGSWPFFIPFYTNCFYGLRVQEASNLNLGRKWGAVRQKLSSNFGLPSSMTLISIFQPDPIDPFNLEQTQARKECLNYHPIEE